MHRLLVTPVVVVDTDDFFFVSITLKFLFMHYFITLLYSAHYVVYIVYNRSHGIVTIYNILASIRFSVFVHNLVSTIDVMIFISSTYPGISCENQIARYHSQIDVVALVHFSLGS